MSYKAQRPEHFCCLLSIQTGNKSSSEKTEKKKKLIETVYETDGIAQI